jgi:hypothetical protein
VVNLKALSDPTTNLGTAKWAALGVAVYDAIRHGVTLSNGAVLLTLAGVDIAARFFNPGPPMPPMPPIMGPR